MIPMPNFALGEMILRALARPYGVSFLRRISIMNDDSMDSQILTHEQRAIELLAESGMSVRTAIVMGKAGIAREEAERRLAASRGRVRQALGEVRQG